MFYFKIRLLETGILRNLPHKSTWNGILLPKLFWPTVRKNCSSDLKNFANSRPSASNFKSFSRLLEQFVQTVKGQNNFWWQNVNYVSSIFSAVSTVECLKKINQDNKIFFALFFLGSSTKTLEWWSFSQRSNFYAWIAPSKIIPSRSTCSSLWQVIIPISKMNYRISSYSFRPWIVSAAIIHFIK